MTKQYVDTAVSMGFAVIDVNIPRYTTRANVRVLKRDGGLLLYIKPDLLSQDLSGYNAPDAQEARLHATNELATYLWENYVEVSDATRIVLLGIGDAYQGLVSLLNASEHAANSGLVNFTVAFVAESALTPVYRESDPMFSTTFRNRSCIFASPHHHVWQRYEGKKIPRKYGNLKKSTSTNMSEMLVEHLDEVKQILTEALQSVDGETSATPTMPLATASLSQQAETVRERTSSSTVGSKAVVEGPTAARGRSTRPWLRQQQPQGMWAAQRVVDKRLHNNSSSSSSGGSRG